MEGHRFERQKSVAGFVHRLYLGLESTRRADRAQLAGGVDQDGNRVGVVSCDPANVVDKTTVAHVGTGAADTNDITCSTDTAAGTRAKGRVSAAGGGKKRTLTDGCIATGVVEQRQDPVGGI